MLILGLDSAAAACNVCLWQDGKILAAFAEAMERGQDQRLMPMIVDIMKKTGVDFPVLDRIAVTRGPGSFTGIRIGLAAARGIGLAAEKPVIGIDRFAIYREQIKRPGKNLLIVVNSKRSELFCRFFPVNGTPEKPNMMVPEEITAFLAENKNTIVAGDAAVTGVEILPPTENEILTAVALAAKVTPGDGAFLPRPLYIRAPDVTIAPRAAIR